MYRTLIGNLRLWRVQELVSSINVSRYESILEEVGMKHKSLLLFVSFQ